MKTNPIKANFKACPERSPEFVEGRSPEYVEGRSPEFVEGRSPEYVEGQSPEHVEGRSPEFVEGRSPEFVEGRSPEHVQGRSRMAGYQWLNPAIFNSFYPKYPHKKSQKSVSVYALKSLCQFVFKSVSVRDNLCNTQYYTEKSASAWRIRNMMYAIRSQKLLLKYSGLPSSLSYLLESSQSALILTRSIRSAFFVLLSTLTRIAFIFTSPVAISNGNGNCVLNDFKTFSVPRPSTESCAPVIPISVIYAVPLDRILSSAVTTWV